MAAASVSTGTVTLTERRGAARKEAEEPELLDSDEQEHVIASLRDAALAQDRLWSRALGALGAVLSVLLAALAVRQLTHPSSNHIHATLETRVGTNYLFFLQVLSSVSYALSSVYVNRRVRFLRYMSSLFAFYASISWGAEFFQLGISQLAFSWLPLGNLVFHLLCLYTEYDAGRLLTQVHALEGMRYSFKKL